eukprot:Hpha_TRINITY_DN8973_c0_g1::TRINITY_DN8973_c0_g1_i1::g.80810::m.80810
MRDTGRSAGRRFVGLEELRVSGAEGTLPLLEGFALLAQTDFLLHDVAEILPHCFLSARFFLVLRLKVSHPPVVILNRPLLVGQGLSTRLLPVAHRLQLPARLVPQAGGVLCSPPCVRRAHLQVPRTAVCGSGVSVGLLQCTLCSLDRLRHLRQDLVVPLPRPSRVSPGLLGDLSLPFLLALRVLELLHCTCLRCLCLLQRVLRRGLSAVHRVHLTLRVRRPQLRLPLAFLLCSQVALPVSQLLPRPVHLAVARPRGVFVGTKSALCLSHRRISITDPPRCFLCFLHRAVKRRLRLPLPLLEPRPGAFRCVDLTLLRVIVVLRLVPEVKTVQQRRVELAEPLPLGEGHHSVLIRIRLPEQIVLRRGGKPQRCQSKRLAELLELEDPVSIRVHFLECRTHLVVMRRRVRQLLRRHRRKFHRTVRSIRGSTPCLRRRARAPRVHTAGAKGVGGGGGGGR